MDIVERIQIGLRRLLDAGMVGGAGIVDEIVEAVGAEVRERTAYTLREVAEAACVAGVELQGDGALPGLGDESDDLVGLLAIGAISGRSHRCRGARARARCCGPGHGFPR